MSARLIPALILGIAGVAVLMSLGFWQLSRLDQKLAQIAAIEARIGDAPRPLPAQPDPEADRFRPVTVTGRYTGAVAHVLSSREGFGPGSRVIAEFETAEGRRLLVDRGYLPAAARESAGFASETFTLSGNLDWPQDTDSYTPEPDLDRNLWFARSVVPLSRHLGTEPVMVVARSDAPVPRLVTDPVNSAGLRNDHLEYAITWFLLAATWAGMTLFLLWRIRQGRA
ncbi:SURF1 family protein [Pararhodobacter sp. SW119]|uniref:SURF1 family protein n=1 Tax=Pararhodobacter sp. SW119 TaxID=2780075 RepID=UPI001ADF6BF0|nr:SURF1 family protein [Pararhodobacter sp. SW119]